MGEDRIAERQRVFKQYKEDVKERGKPFFPFAMWHDTVMSFVVVLVIIGLAVVWKWSVPGDHTGTASGLAREALRRAGRPGHVQLRPAPRLVLLLPLLPAAGLQVALVGDPRHGRDPDDPAAPPDRDPVHRHAGRAASAQAAGGDGRERARDPLDGDPHLPGRRRRRRRSGPELLKQVPTWAKEQGFVGNKQAVAGAKLFATLGCLNCHTYLGSGNHNLGAPDLSDEGSQGAGRLLPDRAPQVPLVREQGQPDAAVREPGQRQPHEARDLPRGVEGAEEVAARERARVHRLRAWR